MDQDKTPVNYQEQIAAQQELVDRLSEEHKKKPSPELEMQIRRRTDTILHLSNLAKEESPKDRARKAAEQARLSALGKAIVHQKG